MIVADTNLIAYLSIEGDLTLQAEAVYQKDSDWIAPYLWRSEFRNILALYLRKNLISLEEATAIMNQGEALLSGKEYEVNSSNILRLANISHPSAYDCEYVTLAQESNVPLVTSDRKIIKAFTEIAISPADFILL